MINRILVTGSDGFVGTALCHALLEKGYDVRAALRSVCKQDKGVLDSASVVVLGDIGSETEWGEALRGITTVVHLAGRAHILRETESSPLAAFRHVNTAGTERLAWASVEHGVRRFVYISSIGVNGNLTFEAAFSEQDEPKPHSSYAVSKWEAEQVLRRIAAKSGMEVVIVRPPLVYGSGVKANFLRLLKWVDKGIPLPLARVKNHRSLVALDNLVDFLEHCVRHPRAAGETFFVSDGDDLSTPELICQIAAKMGRPARLIPFPLGLLHMGARLLGKRAVMKQLTGSLQVDIGKAERILGWRPAVSVDEGLDKVVTWYIREKERHNV